MTEPLRTNYNAAHALAVQDARAAVVDAAKALYSVQKQMDHADQTIEDADQLQKEWNRLGVLYEKAEDALMLAAEALDAVERGAA
jgi:hypothetical protein